MQTAAGLPAKADDVKASTWVMGVGMMRIKNTLARDGASGDALTLLSLLVQD
jgi:hypothetical protein